MRNVLKYRWGVRSRCRNRALVEIIASELQFAALDDARYGQSGLTKKLFYPARRFFSVIRPRDEQAKLHRTYGSDTVIKASRHLSLFSRWTFTRFRQREVTGNLWQEAYGQSTMACYPPHVSKVVSYPNDFRLCGSTGTRRRQMNKRKIPNVSGMKACCGYGNKVNKNRVRAVMNLNYILNKRTDGANPFKIFAELSKFDKDALAFGIKRMSYQAFLLSSYWFAVASTAKSRAGMRCQVCNCPDKIQVHHRTYDTHGYEHLNMMDLVVLCDNCHGLFHGHQPPEYVPQRLRTREPKVKLPKNLVIPHSDADVSIPDGEVIILTRELVDNCRANGSFTNATLNAFGLSKPLVSGWTFRLIGKQMTREKYREAREGRFIYRAKLKPPLPNGV
jgi:hypothetical protein